MNQIPNIEETHDTETEEVNAKIYEYVHHFEEREVSELPLGGLYKIVEVALTAQKQTHHQQLQKTREEERQRIRQFLRGLHLLDYYCKCDDIGHVLAMPRKDYDRLISELDQDKK